LQKPITEIHPVTVDFNDLLSDVSSLGPQIAEAFGFDGPGLIAVKNVPNLTELRQQLLPLAHRFANLPEGVLAKYEHAESHYSFGWSHGKEMMSAGKPDFSKGSYYANPTFDVPFEDEALIKEYPSFCHPNIWPTADLPEMENAFKVLATLVVNVGKLLAKQCDKYVQSVTTDYPANKLHDIIDQSRTCKARLLHYFPLTAEAIQSMNEEAAKGGDDPFSSWCGWHNDHGSLTGLVPAMYFDADGKQIACPDPAAGLYILTRHGQTVKVLMPSDCLGFQIGETAHVHSGGKLLATPHCVRAANVAGVSRSTLAVFMEPMMFESMNIPACTFLLDSFFFFFCRFGLNSQLILFFFFGLFSG
jgi:isopenicillin N synthase-like dioxygenase